MNDLINKRKTIIWQFHERVSADQYHLPVSRAPVPTRGWGWVFFKVIRWQVFSFQMTAGSSLIFFKKNHTKYVVFMCRTIKILILNGPRTRKFSQLLRVGKTVAFDFSHGHALVTLYVQFLFSGWSKFDRWVHAESLCILKLVYFDSWRWQRLCQLVTFLTVFFHWMCKMEFSC